MKSIPNRLFIYIIVALAFFFRIYKVDTIPPALSWDEVSIGYNAFSLLKTGKDEHQRVLPIDTFVSYGDYKPPIPIYITVISVFLFGLTEFSVRLPSALFGTGMIIVIYELCRELFGRSEKSQRVGVIAAILLSVSPWSLELSRAGWEANIGAFFILLGILLIYKSRYSPRYLYICWVPFVAAIYTFNSARYAGPVIGLSVVLLLNKHFWKYRLQTVIGGVLALLMLVPIIPHILSPEARLRFAEVNIFTDNQIVTTANSRMEYDEHLWWSNIFHNRRIGYFRSYFVHFFDHFEPWFLFVKGDGNPKFSLQDVGQLYIMDAPFLVLGFYLIFLNYPLVGWLLIFWIVGSIIPAAVARETPHALRIANSIPAWYIAIAFGWTTVIDSLWVRSRGKALVALCVAGLALSVGYFFHTYIHHYSREYSGEWQYGYREAIHFIQPIQSSYKKVVISDVIGRPYMYTLFYTKYDPEEFWNTRMSYFDAAGFYMVESFGQYEFVRATPQEWNSQYLYILSPPDVPTNAHVLFTIKLLNGDPILTIFDFL